MVGVRGDLESGQHLGVVEKEPDTKGRSNATERRDQRCQASLIGAVNRTQRGLTP
jgi:hypothetical protein